MTGVVIRRAVPEDLAVLYGLLMELAEYERLLDTVRLTQEGFNQALFGAQPALEAIMADLDGESVGFALFYPVFPSFHGRPGMYLEDIYVRPVARGRGIGKSLLATVSRITHERGYGRLDWAVLNWNHDAIRFYESLGARPKTGWTIYQLMEDALARVADEGANVEPESRG